MQIANWLTGGVYSVKSILATKNAGPEVCNYPCDQGGDSEMLVATRIPGWAHVEHTATLFDNFFSSQEQKAPYDVTNCKLWDSSGSVELLQN